MTYFLEKNISAFCLITFIADKIIVLFSIMLKIKTKIKFKIFITEFSPK